MNAFQIGRVDASGMCSTLQISVSQALSTVFRLNKNVQNIEESSSTVCHGCAEVLSHVYSYYTDFVALTHPNAPIHDIVMQLGIHRQESGIQEIPVEIEDEEEDITSGTDIPSVSAVERANLRRRSRTDGKWIRYVDSDSGSENESTVGGESRKASNQDQDSQKVLNQVYGSSSDHADNPKAEVAGAASILHLSEQ
jgi:hypothetical protein